MSLMNFRLSKNISAGADNLNKIYSMSWSPNLLRLAIATGDKKIALYDENGTKQELFSTKSFKSNPNLKNYTIKDIQFSPCSTKLAIAQSDNIVMIYNLGSKFGDKKTICNKFEQDSQISCMIWPSKRINEIYIGLINGKVKLALTKSQSSSTLYSSDTMVVSLSCSPDNKIILSGHVDGTINKYNLENKSLQKFAVHSSIPYCLTWGLDILAAGNDGKVVFYNDSGLKLQTFDYTNDEKLKEFTRSIASPNSDLIAVGNYNKFFVYIFNKRKQAWEEGCIKSVEGLYSVTSLIWKPDGSALLTGNMLGSVDLFEAYLKKNLFKDKFEIIYVTQSQLIVRNIESKKKLIINPKLSQDILGIKIYKDNYIIMTNRESLIIGEIDSEKQSEIYWNVTNKEKFDFSNPNVCMIYNAGELALVEYGNNEILGYCRTEYIHVNLISVRLFYANQTINKINNKTIEDDISVNTTNNLKNTQNIKIIAYLIDLNTIYIQDLVLQNIITTITHEEKIDYLELNKSGNKLIYRDRKKQLYLYNLLDGKKNTLLNYCGYVKWVPNSEVLVAQDASNMCIWYNVDDTDKVKVTPIKGEISDILRKQGKTEVIVNEGINNQTYLLDDGLISFSSAIDDNNLNKAVSILENLEMNTDTETHWKSLAKEAINNKNLIIAQRCYAAINNYPKAKYIQEVIELSEKMGADHPLVQAKLLIIDKQFNNAENLLLKNNLLDETMDVLMEVQKWDESVKIAEMYSHPKIKEIKQQYYNWLIDNDQLDKAAKIKEMEGDYNSAIKHYLNGGYPANAANLVKMYGIDSFDSSILENIVKSLLHVGIYEKAGELLEIMGHFKRSLEAYQKGYCYSKAVELAKKNMPSLVEKLEEEWGDYLSNQRHNETAVIHYIEANKKDKAIEAAILARKWERAIDLANSCPDEIALPYFVHFGDHYSSLHKMDVAEKYYIRAGLPVLCLNMYIKYGKWDKAESLSKKFLQDDSHKDEICKEAENFEKIGKYKEAEKLYLIANEPKIAIAMYKDAKQYDNMIRLVSKYSEENLKEAYIMIANLIKNEPNPNLKLAENHFIQANEWRQCALMYKQHGMYEEALKIIKTYGNKGESNSVIKEVVLDLPEKQSKKLLQSLNMIEALIDLELQKNNIEGAIELAEKNAKYKLPEIYIMLADKFEDEKRYHEAEEYFLKANQIKEIILMYSHIKDYNSAIRVARQHSPQELSSLYQHQAALFLEKGDFNRAENSYIQGKAPDVMCRYYMDRGLFNEAMKFALKNCPQYVDDIRHLMSKQSDLEVNSNTINNLTGKELIQRAELKISSQEYQAAIQLLLCIDSNKIADNNDVLESCWEKAIKLCLEHDKPSLSEVVLKVASNLVSINRFENAGKKYEGIAQIEDAFDCYLKAGAMDHAHRIVNSLKPSPLKSKLEAKLSTPVKSNEADEQEIKEIIKRGEEDKALENAMKTSDELFNKYLIAIVRFKYLLENNFLGASLFLSKYQTPIYKYNLELYVKLSEEMLIDENLQDLKAIKEMLGICLSKLVDYEEYTDEMKKLNRLYKISYYQLMKYSMKQDIDKFSFSYYKVCLHVLSYGDIIKFDVALLDAGYAARDKNLKGVAYVLLNRYIDIYSIIEDDNIELEPDKEFENTDIPQKNLYTSDNNIINPNQKEDIQTWIVKNSIDKSIVIGLPKKNCPKCKNEIYEGKINCCFCSYQYDQCIITGHPVNTSSDTVSCSNCKKKALKDAWKEWISLKEHCPNCNSIQISYK